MILGHAALAVMARKTLRLPAPMVLLLLASCGPDVIDKAAMLLLGTPSKWIGHTLLLSAAVALAFLPARRGRFDRVWWAVTLLWLSHLILDLTEPAVLFWPALGGFPADAPYDLADGFFSFYSGRGNILVLAFDLACLAAALAATLPGWIRRRPGP